MHGLIFKWDFQLLHFLTKCSLTNMLHNILILKKEYYNTIILMCNRTLKSKCNTEWEWSMFQWWLHIELIFWRCCCCFVFFFFSFSNSHNQKVQMHMLDLMSSIIMEGDGVTQELLDTILINLIPAHKVWICSSTSITSVNQFWHWSPKLCAEFMHLVRNNCHICYCAALLSASCFYGQGPGFLLCRVLLCCFLIWVKKKEKKKARWLVTCLLN